MGDRTEFLILGRAMHNALRKAIDEEDWPHERISEIRPFFEHYSCVMYLSGTLTYLEDKYGTRPWNKTGSDFKNFDDYVYSCKIKSFKIKGVSTGLLEALVCIRNAVIHNGSDLSKNRDTDSYAKVLEQNIPNITLNGTIVKLNSSDYSNDFMETIRQCYLAVAMYHGDG